MVWHSLVSHNLFGGGDEWCGLVWTDRRRQTDADRQTDVCLSDYPSVCLPIKK